MNSKPTRRTTFAFSHAALVAFFASNLCMQAAVAGPDEIWQQARKAEQVGDYPGMVKLLLPLAEEGDIAAQYMVGLMHETGQSGQRDLVIAAKWYRKAADQGFARAQYYLGDLYYRGKGDMQNYGEAMKWYRRAADQGTAMAQHMLGIMYVKGQGTEQDYVQAYKWFTLASTLLPAAAGGNYQPMATKARDAVEAKMTPEQIAQGKKLVDEWKAVDESPPGKAPYKE